MSNTLSWYLINNTSFTFLLFSPIYLVRVEIFNGATNFEVRFRFFIYFSCPFIMFPAVSMCYYSVCMDNSSPLPFLHWIYLNILLDMLKYILHIIYICIGYSIVFNQRSNNQMTCLSNFKVVGDLSSHTLVCLDVSLW
jgi:hypothetical protein